MNMVTQISPRTRNLTRYTPRQRAWAAILFEAAQSDRIVKSAEINEIVQILMEEFSLEYPQALALCERYSRDHRRPNAKDVIARARKVFGPYDKIKIPSALQRVVEADGLVVDVEAQFVADTLSKLDS